MSSLPRAVIVVHGTAFPGSPRGAVYVRSSIISGKLRLDVGEMDLSALINAVMETVRPAADAREIAIDTTLDPTVVSVTGDPTRLQQCV